jgi:sugar O-acyltransferase (sialic acid O-acetyltransferase NeuD family)
MKPLVLFGAGGHAREIAQIVRDLNAAAPRWNLLGALVDPAFPPAGDAAAAPVVLGGPEWLDGRRDTAVVIAVGASSARAAIARRLRARFGALEFPALVHPGAWLAAGTRVGEGSVVFAGALVNVGVRLGAHVIVNLGCTVSHDCDLADFVSLGPGVHLPGNVRVGEAADLGAGCCARPGARIGARVILGAGAVVVDDLPDDCLAAGVPARPLPR